MCEPPNDFEEPSRTCSSWAEIVECLEKFPSPEVAYTEDGLTRTSWVFRGLTDSRFGLEPAIERHARSKGLTWFALEKLVTSEFKSHARMHLSAALVPGPQEELTWLAQMQHYGIPTRLLDFTRSPFVALYFAVRDGQRSCENRSHVRLWAIDEVAVNGRFWGVASQARREARARAGKPEPKRVASGLNPDDFYTIGDQVVSESQELQKLIAKSMSASGTRRVELERQGCVAVASPPAFNPRLASQQGVFLANCAEDLTFWGLLSKMMKPYKGEWYKRIDIAVEAISEVEQRLFQMNIHEQSLFPDMQGLAGFIRPKLRLHWK
jgi:FRG domain